MLYDAIPQRIRIHPDLLIDEFVNRHSNHPNLVAKANSILFSKSTNVMETIEFIQSFILAKKTQEFLFFRVDVSFLNTIAILACFWIL